MGSNPTVSARKILDQVPFSVIATADLFHSARLVNEASRRLGFSSDEQHYSSLADHVASGFAIEPKQLVHFARETRGLSSQHGLDIVRRIDVGSAGIERHLEIWLAAVSIVTLVTCGSLDQFHVRLHLRRLLSPPKPNQSPEPSALAAVTDG